MMYDGICLSSTSVKAMDLLSTLHQKPEKRSISCKEGRRKEGGGGVGRREEG